MLLGQLQPLLLTAASFRSRASMPHMAGFEQKPPIGGLERVAVLVTGSKQLLDSLPRACREVDASLSGVVYSLPDERLEVIAEGSRAQLDKLVGLVHQVIAVDSNSATSRAVWQPPTGGYGGTFPLVALHPKMLAQIDLDGDKQTLDFYTLQLQLEAVFNRGLKLNSKRPQNEQLKLTVSGDTVRLKSFVRWCQRGPPMQRADRVQVEWEPLN
mmetsp:Transcript_21625/g.46619  ORF Transcript_21625/g.46619 Transcript_21625/m.46619 type:complete len:213 (-) Transcript_21625:283-921(-)